MPARGSPLYQPSSTVSLRGIALPLMGVVTCKRNMSVWARVYGRKSRVQVCACVHVQLDARVELSNGNACGVWQLFRLWLHLRPAWAGRDSPMQQRVRCAGAAVLEWLRMHANTMHTLRPAESAHMH